MTGQELNTYLNVHRKAANAKLVSWATSSAEYRAAMASAGMGLVETGAAAPAAAPASVPAAAAPATPSTPGIDSKMATFVTTISQKEAQQLYELLYTVRGCRIYKH